MDRIIIEIETEFKIKGPVTLHVSFGELYLTGPQVPPMVLKGGKFVGLTFEPKTIEDKREKTWIGT